MMLNKKQKVLLIIPAYNEEDNILNTCRKIEKAKIKVITNINAAAQPQNFLTILYDIIVYLSFHEFFHILGKSKMKIIMKTGIKNIISK